MDFDIALTNIGDREEEKEERKGVSFRGE